MSVAEETVVELAQGRLRGKRDVSVFGDEFYCFHRIPYAKPPVGDLRFKSPQPAEGWSGVRDATTEGAVCPSLDMQRANYLPDSDEDSLFVNVYCKYSPRSTKGKKYPVLVWIHGGGFEFGSGNRSMCGPDYFMLHEVLLVTFNYRLGVLGFLSLQTPECPGNFGLKDQLLALKWIKSNIGHFGGDPENITLFGVSAGAASVHYQTLVPSSAGLFKKAIAQSGSSLNRWGYAKKPRENAFALGRRLGCDTKDDEVLLEFLKRASAKDITLSSRRLIEETEGKAYGESFLCFTFTPTTEPDHEKAFVSKHPWILLEEGQYLDVPYITGVCEKEMVIGVKGSEDVLNFTKDEEFQALIPRDVLLERNGQKALALASKIREFYFKDGVTYDKYIDLLSDTFFNYGVYKVVKSRTTNKKLKSPTFLYQFVYEGNQPFIKQLLGLEHFKGASHGEDTNYIFKTFFTDTGNMKPGSRDYEVMWRMTSLWVNFAKSGAPHLERPPLIWQQTNAEDLTYLNLGEEFEVGRGLMKDRMEFWDEIYSSFYNK